MNGKIPIDSQFPQAGLAAYFDKPIWRDPARVERIARLLLDDRWPWLPWYAAFYGIDRQYDRPSKRVGGKNGVEFLVEGLMSPTVSRLAMVRSKGDGNHGEVKIATGRHVNKHDAPFSLIALSRVAELPVGKTTAGWLSLVQDLVVEVAPLNAILCVWPGRNPAMSDTRMLRMVLDTRWGQYELGVLPSSADRTNRSMIGRTYARYPRWGTYLSEAHLAAIGGAERVLADVAPARIDRIGELTYIQLTASIETAMTVESGERRRRLETLMAPILEPRGNGPIAL